MKNIFRLILLLLLPALATAQANEQSLVKKTFNNYKTAILNDKGEEAVKYVDSRTIKYYTDILDKVKNADSTAVEELSLMDKLMVFSIRHRTSKEDILSMDGAGLFIYAIKNGMVGKNSVSSNTVGIVTMNKDFAKGQLISNGKAAPLYFHFYKEDNLWKLDLTSLFPVANTAFKQMADESGQPENEYLFQLLEILTGKKPGAEIWQKVN